MNFSKFILSLVVLAGLSSALIEAGRYGYGSLSQATGRPTTSYVGGYYKSNGTYVDSYWRS